MRALRRFDEESFVVKLPEGHQIAVPAWMLDAVFCSQLQQRDHPLIALEALLELAELIETAALAFFSDRFRIWAITLEEEESMRPEPEERLSSTETGLCEEGAVGKTSRTQSSSLPRTDR